VPSRPVANANRYATARVFLAFLIAPLVPGLLIAVAGALYFLVSATRVDPRDYFGLAAISAMLGYPIALIPGLPLYHIFRTLSLDAAWIYALAGIGFGALMFAIYPLLPGFSSAVVDLTVVPIVMVCAVAVTLSFWLIARPDRRPRYPDAP
jgi:hypothetical protein